MLLKDLKPKPIISKREISPTAKADLRSALNRLMAERKKPPSKTSPPALAPHDTNGELSPDRLEKMLEVRLEDK